MSLPDSPVTLRGPITGGGHGWPFGSAAFDHLLRWLKDATPPPVGDRIRIAGDPPRIFRDEHGNALGGIRMPGFAVPTGRHSGFAADGTLDLFGSNEPFDPQTLSRLYPQHDDYVAAFRAAAEKAVEAGVLLPAHAAAATSGIA